VGLESEVVHIRFKKTVHLMLIFRQFESAQTQQASLVDRERLEEMLPLFSFDCGERMSNFFHFCKKDDEKRERSFRDRDASSFFEWESPESRLRLSRGFDCLPGWGWEIT